MKPGDLAEVTLMATVAEVDEQGDPVRLTFLSGYSHKPVGLAANARPVANVAPWQCPRPDDPHGCYCPTDHDCLVAEPSQPSTQTRDPGRRPAAAETAVTRDRGGCTP
jgi:hypothetical protein